MSRKGPAPGIEIIPGAGIFFCFVSRKAERIAHLVEKGEFGNAEFIITGEGITKAVCKNADADSQNIVSAL
jgi:chaperonin GroEL (HSP60 family)